MRRATQGLLVVFAVLAAGAWALQPPAPFSMALTVTGSGVTARCDDGCAWRQVGATFPRPAYRVTDLGISPVYNAEGLVPRPSGQTFSFVVTPERRGFTATCEAGCAWVRLSAANNSRTFTVTETGVSAGAP